MYLGALYFYKQVDRFICMSFLKISVNITPSRPSISLSTVESQLEFSKEASLWAPQKNIAHKYTTVYHGPFVLKTHGSNERSNCQSDGFN